MEATTRVRHMPDTRLRKGIRPSALRAASVLALVLILPGQGLCDLTVLFLVDRTGSMWAPLQGRAKILQVTEAIDRVLQDLPDEVAVGLRVYPPPEQGAQREDPGLLIPTERGNRDRFPEEARRLNPQGRGSLRKELARTLESLPGGPDTKLLFVLCDGADSGGVSFCDTELETARPQGLRFYAISLDLKNVADQEDINCLSRQMEGEAIHLSPGDDMASTLLPIARKAYEEESEKRRRAAEEEGRLQELLSKTRLKVEIHNTLDSFFADFIQADRVLLEEEEIPLVASARLQKGEETLLFDRNITEGSYKLSLRYSKWKNERAVSSREVGLSVQVEEGKTVRVRCFPTGTLFSWELTCETDIF
jgi:hypothetical protein